MEIRRPYDFDTVFFGRFLLILLLVLFLIVNLNTSNANAALCRQINSVHDCKRVLY